MVRRRLLPFTSLGAWVKIERPTRNNMVRDQEEDELGGKEEIATT
jgi:hypothetical protein